MLLLSQQQQRMEWGKGGIDGMHGTVPKLKHACKMLHSGAKAGIVVVQVSIHNSGAVLRSQDQGEGAL